MHGDPRRTAELPPRRRWTGGTRSAGSPFAAAYYPHVVVSNPLAPPDADQRRQRFLTVPPSGHVAGVWARTDAGRGVHKAPANEVIRGITPLETTITEAEQAR